MNPIYTKKLSAISLQQLVKATIWFESASIVI